MVQLAHKDAKAELCGDVLVNLRGSQQGGAQDSWAVKGIQGEDKDWSHPNAIAARSSLASK